MSILIKGMEMPKNCMECQWYYFQNSTCTNPVYYLDSRCKLIPSGQDWYGYDGNGGWIGEDIDQENKRGYYYYHHCVEKGKRAKQCPLVSVPEPHGRLIDADAFIGTIRPLCEEDKYTACTFETVKRLMLEHINNAPTIIPAEEE